MEDNIDYNELFGIESAKEQEAAEPDTEDPKEDGEKGAKEQDVAEPAVADDKQKETKQTPEENAAFAAARRKAEQERDAAIAAAKAEAQKEIDEAFAASGLTNPYTGKPITSKAEYDAYKEKYDKERHERVLKKSGMSSDEFRKYVDALPEVREAKAAAAEMREQQARLKVEEQLREIGAMDPSIKKLEDLVKMPNYGEFYERVKRGMTLSEAYKLTNYEALTRGTAAAGRQAALNAAASKAHMAQTQTRGGGAQSVPQDVMEQYRILCPDATDAEIQAHYNKNHKT